MDEADPAGLEAVAARYAISITPTMVERMTGRSDDPVVRQFVPTAAELTRDADELIDPIGDARYSPVPGMTHRYQDRVLLKPLHVCPVYCRFCFRREVVGPEQGLLERFLCQRQAAIVKVNRSSNGHGTFVVTAYERSSLMERLRRHVTDQPHRRCGWVFEEFLPFVAAPSVELRVDDEGVHDFYVCDQRTRDNAWTGMVTPAGTDPTTAAALPALVDAGRRVGGWLRERGYRGTFDVDCGLMPGGYVVTEANVRRTGGTYLEELARRLCPHDGPVHWRADARSGATRLDFAGASVASRSAVLCRPRDGRHDRRWTVARLTLTVSAMERIDEHVLPWEIGERAEQAELDRMLRRWAANGVLADRVREVADSHLLFIAGRSIRFEEFNGRQLSATALRRWLVNSWRRYAHAAGRPVPAGLAGRPLEDLANGVSELTDAVNRSGWIRFRRITGATFAKTEVLTELPPQRRSHVVLPLLIRQLADRCSPDAADSVLPAETAVGMIVDTLLERPAGEAGAGLAALLATIVRAAVAPDHRRDRPGALAGRPADAVQPLAFRPGQLRPGRGAPSTALLLPTGHAGPRRVQ